MINIFIVETDENCQSDKKYILSFIKNVYSKKGIKNVFVYMNGKGNYSENGVISKTNKFILNYININCLTAKEKRSLSYNDILSKYKSEYNVFLCIDIDAPKDAHANDNNEKLNKKIFDYVDQNGYELIWFYEDVEDTFLGKKIANNEKKKESERFFANCKPSDFNLAYLSMNELVHFKRRSNIKNILDKYYI